MEPAKHYKTPATGMTFVEMLITLSLLSALATLMFNALALVNKSSQRAFHYQNQSTQHQRLDNSLSQLLSKQRPPAGSTPTDFNGTPSQWLGISDQPLSLSPGRPYKFRLWLETRNGTTSLYYETPDIDLLTPALTPGSLQSDTAGLLIGSWPAPEAPQLRYLNHQQQWQNNWQGSIPYVLPLAICLCYPEAPPDVYPVRQRRTKRAPRNTQ